MSPSSTAALVVCLATALSAATAPAGGIANPLYPDLVPYVYEDAPPELQSLQNWSLSGNTLRYSTLFSNQGDGLFEIRRGDDISSERHELIQRVYLNNDFGAEFVDLPIGDAPIPGSPANPNPNVPFPTDSNLIWFEDFTKFSLHEAPLVGGLLTVGPEVAGELKTSWRLSANRGPLPEYVNPPRYTSPDQSVQQRISVGWADLYTAGAFGQSFDITGVAFGPLYWLRQTVDPEDRIHETDETNNSFEVLIDLNRPGEAIMFAGEFVQPGDSPPPAPGDLNQDGQVDVGDWLAFKAGANTDLAGLAASDAYLLGDLNLDGQHSLQDVVLFRQYFDEANGAGSFAAVQSTPEPSSMLLLGVVVATLGYAGHRFRHRCGKACLVGVTVTAFLLASPIRVSLARVTLFSEDFEGLTLGPNVDENTSNPNAWTDTPPPGWTVDDSGVPSVGVAGVGVTEWEGWSFADKDWWTTTAFDQGRSQFDLGQGAVAIADPDEWDDRGSPLSLGLFNAVMQTPPIPLGAAGEDAARLSFASSWRDECCDDNGGVNNQTAVILASYNGGDSFTEVLRWESNPESQFYKSDATNESVTIDLNNPAGAQDVVIRFAMEDAGNDWWWAIDNIEVFTPSALVVNTETGEMTISGGTGFVGYEVTSPGGSLNPDGWQAGNFDAQNLGSPTPMTADFNNDQVVDTADFTLWRDSLGANALGDANDDGQTDIDDYALWFEQFGASVGPGETWETLIAEEGHLLEFFLSGDSTFTDAPIGAGYDPAQDARDLRFVYSLSDGQEVEGVVLYEDPLRRIAAPEPQSLLGLSVAFASLAGARSRREI